MASSEGSSVVNSCLRVRPIESDEELVEANMDLLRAHVLLIMAGTLTIEESKPVLRSVFSALRRFHGDGWLVYTGKHRSVAEAAGEDNVDESCSGGRPSDYPGAISRFEARLERGEMGSDGGKTAEPSEQATAGKPYAD